MFIDYDNKDAIFLRIVIETVTSIRSVTYENIQVANYGVGGFYFCHHDYFSANYGSAVFWYNMHPNNTVNVDTMHCACPPVFGDKWVANVWIIRNNNEFSTPSLGDMLSTSELSTVIDEFKNDSARIELNQFITQQERRMDKMLSMSRLLDETSKGTKNAKFDIHHPINALRFIRNNSVVFNRIKEEISQEMKLYTEVHTKLEELMTNVKTFHEEELTHVIHGLLVIQQIYNITSYDMVNGNVGKYKTIPLTAAECEDIMVKVVHNAKYFSTVESWIEACLKKIEHKDSTTTATQLLTRSAVAFYGLGSFQEAVTIYSKVSYLNQKSRYHKLRLKYYMRKFIKHRNEQTLDNSISTGKLRRENNVKEDFRLSFKTACQGNVPRLVGATQKTLVCDRVDNGHPLLLIQPIKREIISREPFIVVYHDFISTNRMMSLRQVAFPQLERSTVLKKDSRAHVSRRTSKSMFIEHDNKDGLFLSNAIEAVTSLRSAAYEKVQVANYGIGGLYDCHYDYYPAHYYDNDIFDNRMATFMLYMSDVGDGGGTAFPDIPEVVFPKMGSAVFWYNMHPNNTVNEDTLHCACPPLFGDKWVANVWIKRNNNEFAAQCSLDQYTTSWW
ncbi:Prolyl 4-hydroxylase subunit alpha-3 [Mactra antiquata]